MTPDQAQHVIEEALAQVAPDVDIAGITPTPISGTTSGWIHWTSCASSRS